MASSYPRFKNEITRFTVALQHCRHLLAIWTKQDRRCVPSRAKRARRIVASTIWRECGKHSCHYVQKAPQGSPVATSLVDSRLAIKTTFSVEWKSVVVVRSKHHIPVDVRVSWALRDNERVQQKASYGKPLFSIPNCKARIGSSLALQVLKVSTTCGETSKRKAPIIVATYHDEGEEYVGSGLRSTKCFDYEQGVHHLNYNLEPRWMTIILTQEKLLTNK